MTAAIAETSLGPILVAASDEGIHRVEFGDDESTLREKLDADYPDAIADDRLRFRAMVDCRRPADRLTDEFSDLCRWIFAEPHFSGAFGKRCSRFPSGQRGAIPS